MLEQHSFGYWLRLERKALDLIREALANRVGTGQNDQKQQGNDSGTKYLFHRLFP
jgi:hypothetical protein